MLFIWDPGKARANIKKMEFPLTWQSGDSQTLVVVHLYWETANNEVVRIISARKATKREKKQDEEGI